MCRVELVADAICRVRLVGVELAPKMWYDGDSNQIDAISDSLSYRGGSGPLQESIAAMNEQLDRISIDPKIMVGKPVIRGTRIPVELIVRMLAQGIPENDIAAFGVGGEATIEVDAFPGRVFEGRIHLIGPAAVGLVYLQTTDDINPDSGYSLVGAYADFDRHGNMHLLDYGLKSVDDLEAAVKPLLEDI